ncbi:MAG: hypothetical protein Q4P66_01545 [Actinomycetaceae bacterium]|nr:hypothetical protein [Actinomycetaceae bacterium]
MFDNTDSPDVARDTTAKDNSRANPPLRFGAMLPPAPEEVTFQLTVVRYEGVSFPDEFPGYVEKNAMPFTLRSHTEQSDKEMEKDPNNRVIEFSWQTVTAILDLLELAYSTDENIIQLTINGIPFRLRLAHHTVFFIQALFEVDLSLLEADEQRRRLIDATRMYNSEYVAPKTYPNLTEETVGIVMETFFNIEQGCSYNQLEDFLRSTFQACLEATKTLKKFV